MAHRTAWRARHHPASQHWLVLRDHKCHIMIVRILGIDPGLVHTGCVALEIDQDHREWWVRHQLVMGTDTEEVRRWALRYSHAHTFIEAYRPRSHFDSDARMGKFVNELKKALPGSKTIDNTGVKRVVRPPLMKAIGVWNFSTPTHHQDLRSAARIGIYGGLKDEAINAVLYDLMVGIVDGTGWRQRA